MSQPRDDRQDDLCRSSLEAIINLRHPLVRLAAEINREFLAKRFSSVCRVGPGQPPLPTRLVDNRGEGGIVALLALLSAVRQNPTCLATGVFQAHVAL
jgi:hypothetical protein